MYQKPTNSKQVGYAAILVVMLLAFLTALLANYYLQNIKQPQLTAPPNQLNTLTSISKPKESSESSKLQKDNLTKYLTVEAALLGVSDNISLYFQDLDRQINVSIDPSKSWIPASTIKSYAVLEAFRQRRAGIINFDQIVTIKADNVVPTELETDDFPRLRGGVSVTVGQLVEAMITQSDNTAYNTLLDLLDRRSINNYLRNIGLTETVVGEKLNLDDSQFQKDLAVPGRQPNSTTAKDLASMFDLLYNDKIPNSREILAIFKKQKINNMIPSLLPDGTIVAHKTGDWAPIYHDGGIVYKPTDPFILTVFTNSNDPTVLAKLAKVAYFQTAEVVGQPAPVSQPASNKLGQSSTEYALANSDQANAVLGVTIQDVKFPDITAADLGITANDLSLSRGVSKNIPTALISPGSIFYGTKIFFENLQLSLAQDFNQGTNAHLSLAKSRLSEVRAAASQGDLQQVAQLLDRSENNLAQAANLASANQKSSAELVQTKQVNDLQFATLADIAPNIEPSKKEQFVDMVYNLYQKNQKQVIPKVENSATSNSLSQKPIIATVEKISGNNITIKLDDGTTKQVVTNDTTPVRAFNQTDVKDPGSITEGTKIALIAQSTGDGNITPQFILNDIPKELPAAHTGVVLDLNPEKKTLTIQDQFGQKTEVDVNDTTILKARDTTVSVGGIKAGSVVSIFGQIENNTQTTVSPSLSVTGNPSTSPLTPSATNIQPSTSTTPNAGSATNQTSTTEDKKFSLTPPPSIKAQPATSGSQSTPAQSGLAPVNNLPKPNNSSAAQQTKTSATTNQPPSNNSQTSNPVIKATTVTVIKNSSGDKEVSKSPAKPTTSENQQSKPSNPPPAQPPTNSNSNNTPSSSNQNNSSDKNSKPDDKKK